MVFRGDDSRFDVSRVCHVSNSRYAFGTFFVVFLGSSVLGMAFALLASLMFKYAKLGEHRCEVMETCVFCLIPFISYHMAGKS